jgi:hypothetical protein
MTFDGLRAEAGTGADTGLGPSAVRPCAKQAGGAAQSRALLQRLGRYENKYGQAGPHLEETKLNYSMFFRLGDGGVDMFNIGLTLAHSSQTLSKKQ